MSVVESVSSVASDLHQVTQQEDPIHKKAQELETLEKELKKEEASDLESTEILVKCEKKEVTNEDLIEQEDQVKKIEVKCDQRAQADAQDQLEEQSEQKQQRNEDKSAKQLEEVEKKPSEESHEEGLEANIFDKSFEEAHDEEKHAKQLEEKNDCVEKWQELLTKEQKGENVEKPVEKEKNEEKSLQTLQEIKDTIETEESLKEEKDEGSIGKPLEKEEKPIQNLHELKDIVEQPPEEWLEEKQDEEISKKEENIEEKPIQNTEEIKECIETQPERSQEEEQDEGIDHTPLDDERNEERKVEPLDEDHIEKDDRMDSKGNEHEPLDELHDLNELKNTRNEERAEQEVASKEIYEPLEILAEQSETEEQEDREKSEDDSGEVEDNHNVGAENPPEASGGEMADLPNETVCQTIRQLLQNLWPNLDSTDFELERASAKGDNYLGVVWRICVRPEGSLVIKLPPQNSVRRKQFFARPCFLRESLAYQHFLPLAAEYQKERNIPMEEQFTQYARCQVCRLDEPNECIVLEDLCRAGYDLHDRFAELPVECVRLVMRAYAKLHATSLAIKRQCSERLKQCQSIVDIFEQRRDDHSLGVYFENLKQSALGSLRPADDRQYVERLEAYFARGTFFELLLPLISGSNCEPYSVICHGDCWNNNIMYRLSEKDGRPLDVRLIDWQLMRYASPITDLAYFFFSCTSREFRRNHYKSMLEGYHTEIGKQLTRLGESVDELFPLQAFNEQLQSKCAVGLLLAMMVLPIVTMRGQDVPDLEAISELIEAGGTTSLKGAGFLGSGNEDLYKERMRDVILDCVDNDYI